MQSIDKSYGLCLCPPKFLILKPLAHNVMVFEDETFGRQLSINEVLRVRPS